MGRSEAGKTSLTQALKGEELHYHKTQYTNSNEDTIDSPGEYAESKHFSFGLARNPHSSHTQLSALQILIVVMKKSLKKFLSRYSFFHALLPISW